MRYILFFLFLVPLIYALPSIESVSPVDNQIDHDGNVSFVCEAISEGQMNVSLLIANVTSSIEFGELRGGSYSLEESVDQFERNIADMDYDGVSETVQVCDTFEVDECTLAQDGRYLLFRLTRLGNYFAPLLNLSQEIVNIGQTGKTLANNHTPISNVGFFSTNATTQVAYQLEQGQLHLHYGYISTQMDMDYDSINESFMINGTHVVFNLSKSGVRISDMGVSIDSEILVNITLNMTLNTTNETYGNFFINGTDNGENTLPPATTVLLTRYNIPTTNQTLIANSSNVTFSFNTLRNGTYHWQCSGTDGSGTNTSRIRTLYVSTNLSIDEIPPAGVANLTESFTSNETITWHWNTTDDVNHTILSLNGTNLVNLTGIITNYTFTGLLSSSTYTLVIHTADSSGNINDTDVSDQATTNSTPDTIAPELISLLVSVSNMTANITVISSEASSINLTYGNTSMVNTTLASNRTLFLLDLAPNTTYTYTINLTDAFNNSNMSSTLNFTTQTTPDNLMPTLTFINLTTYQSITILTQASEAVNLTVEYGIGSLNQFIGNATFTVNHTLLIQDLTNSTTYMIRLRYSDIANNTNISLVYNITTNNTPYPSIQSITATASSQSALIEVVTNVPTRALAYYGTSLLDSIVNSSSFVLQHNITLTTLALATTYTYQVNITSASSEVNSSSLLTFTTLSATPEASSTSSDSICYKWECGAWSECKNKQRIRRCYNLGGCQGNSGRPVEKESCEEKSAPFAIVDSRKSNPIASQEKVDVPQAQQKENMPLSNIPAQNSVTTPETSEETIPLGTSIWFLVALAGIFALYKIKLPPRKSVPPKKVEEDVLMPKEEQPIWT